MSSAHLGRDFAKFQPFTLKPFRNGDIALFSILPLYEYSIPRENIVPQNRPPAECLRSREKKNPPPRNLLRKTNEKNFTWETQRKNFYLGKPKEKFYLGKPKEKFLLGKTKGKKFTWENQ